VIPVLSGTLTGIRQDFSYRILEKYFKLLTNIRIGEEHHKGNQQPNKDNGKKLAPRKRISYTVLNGITYHLSQTM